MAPSSRMRSRNKEALVLAGLQTSRSSSALDADAFPKCDVVLDFSRGGLRLGIIPGGVVVLHAVHSDVIVLRGSFPGTNRGVIAVHQDLFFHGFGREILVALNHDRGAALRNHFSAPGCFGHFVRLPSI